MSRKEITFRCPGATTRDIWRANEAINAYILRHRVDVRLMMRHRGEFPTDGTPQERQAYLHYIAARIAGGMAAFRTCPREAEIVVVEAKEKVSSP